MPKELKYIQVAALLIAAIIYLGIKNYPFTKSTSGTDKTEFYYVARVVDGDTLKLSSGEKIRLIGMDTPEVYYSNKLLRDSKRSGTDIKTIQSLGAKASKFTKDLCLGKRVRLEYDAVKHDRYGRTLAYVYLEDGTFVNAKIVEEGYGQIMTVPPNVKYADYFLKLERQAREGKKGLWKFK
ncbi:MAG: thermonuclease family protein [Candidatus Omnitrophica bacterium]|nr:thermonuclease family protein [Candidatus Omnitrophota bacterium]